MARGIWFVAASAIALLACGGASASIAPKHDLSDDDVGQSCDGGSGTCINVDTQQCSGQLLTGQCPGPSNIQCCVPGSPAADDDVGKSCDSGKGTCINTNSQACTGGSLVPGLCPGPSNIECCVAGGSHDDDPSGPWNRTMCAEVAQAWVANGILYNWSPTTKQFVTSGPGLYRSDCSGFVSASWNVAPPGAVTSNMPVTNIAESDLQQCDALLHVGEHVVLFWGWQSPGVPIVVEECGHFSGCCGAEATCPGSCGTAASCNEYCPGCPIQMHAWPSLQGFQPVRYNGW